MPLAYSPRPYISADNLLGDAAPFTKFPKLIAITHGMGAELELHPNYFELSACQPFPVYEYNYETLKKRHLQYIKSWGFSWKLSVKWLGRQRMTDWLNQIAVMSSRLASQKEFTAQGIKDNYMIMLVTAEQQNCKVDANVGALLTEYFRNKWQGYTNMSIGLTSVRTDYDFPNLPLSTPLFHGETDPEMKEIYPMMGMIGAL